MAYVPVATDPTQPADTVDASTAAAEFRALKAYVAGLVLGAAGFKCPVRQTVISGLIASITGLPAFASAGAGLTINISATAKPIILTSAQGFNVNGPVDLNSQITADAAAAWTLPINNTSYCSYDILTSSTGTYTQSLAPPQYSTVYNQATQALLHFDGANNAVVTTDDFGNTWIMQGGAKLTTSYFKFGTTSLGGAGATAALNGAADYIKTAGITFLGGGGWAMRCYTKPLNALPGAGLAGDLGSAVNAGSFGVHLSIFNNGGTIKFTYYLSSNGTTFDIANAVQGTTTPVLGTEYYVELTFDALAGVYRLYVNGVQEASTASTSRVCLSTGAAFGASNIGTNFYQGYIDEAEILPYCDHPNGTAYTPPIAAKSLATAGYASDWFSINEMVMYKVTGPSTVAATPPILTSVPRVYMLEADSTGVGISAIRQYAYNGRYDNIANPTVYAISTSYPFNHNLGVPPEQCQFVPLAKPTPISTPWLEFAQALTAGVNFNSLGGANRNTAFINTGGSGMIVNAVTSFAGLTISSAVAGFLALRAKRSWGGS